MKKILKALSIAVVLAFGATMSFAALPTYAVNKVDGGGGTTADGVTRVQEGVDKINAGNTKDLEGSIKTILSAVFVVIGIIAVVVIIIGAINFTLSQGDPGKVKKAKDTILYGIVGLVVALLAFAIVQFVLNAMR